MYLILLSYIPFMTTYHTRTLMLSLLYYLLVRGEGRDGT